jgi:hypothetical protein
MAARYGDRTRLVGEECYYMCRSEERDQAGPSAPLSRVGQGLWSCLLPEIVEGLEDHLGFGRNSLKLENRDDGQYRSMSM